MPVRCRAEAVLLGIFVFTGALVGILNAQVPERPDRFEVASIRPGGANSGRPSMEFSPGGGFRATNVTLKMLIQVAYDIRPEQLSGGPAWTDSEPYIVIARGPAGGPSLSKAAQQELSAILLRTLLGERFQLVLKREANLAAGYVLIVGKKGQKMTIANDPESHQSLRQTGRWQLRAEAVGMPILARFLSVHLGETVEDRTGLEGGYSFHLDWTPDLPPRSIESLDGLPEESLIPAVQEQLGLRLERQKVVTERYTIERVEKATEN